MLKLKDRRDIDHPLYCIHWISVDDTHRGWQVRIRRKNQDGQHKDFSRFFSAQIDGEDKALEKAQRCRDRNLINNPATKGMGTGIPRRRSDREGIVVGVFKVVRKTKQKVGFVQKEFWAASFSEDGKSKMRQFSVNKYGDSEAKNLAIEARHNSTITNAEKI